MDGVGNVGSAKVNGTEGVSGPGDGGGGAGGTVSLLPDPATQLAVSGDPGAMLAALTIETAKEQRDVSRELRQGEEATQDREEQAEVAAMHDKAGDMRAQAWEEGAFDASAGVMQMAGAGASGGAQTRWEAGATLMKAGGKVVTGLDAAGNEDKDADVVAHKHTGDRARRAADDAHEGEKEAQKLLDTAIDFYREYTSASDQAKAAATHRT